MESANTLTIGAGITINGPGFFGYYGSVGNIDGPIDNLGNIDEDNGGTLNINYGNEFPNDLTPPVSWTNDLNIEVSSGILELGGYWTNSATGTITAGSNTDLYLGDQWNTDPTEDPAGYSSDAWVNNGSIATTDTTVYVGGWLTNATANNLASLNLSTDTVNLIGTLDNSGGVLALTAGVTSSSGSWNLLGGSIYQGTITTAGSAGLVATNTASTLDGVELDGTLDMSQSDVAVTIVNGITLDTDINVSGYDAGIDFQSEVNPALPQTISVGPLAAGGVATIDLSGNYAFMENYSAAPVTIGPGIDIEGNTAYYYYGSTITGSFINQGTIEVPNNGTLYIEGNGDTFTNAGTLKVDSSATLYVFQYSYGVPYNGQFINDGTLMGTGTINGNVVNNGIVQPGDAPGTLTIDGNFTQERKRHAANQPGRRPRHGAVRATCCHRHRHDQHGWHAQLNTCPWVHPSHRRRIPGPEFQQPDHLRRRVQHYQPWFVHGGLQRSRRLECRRSRRGRDRLLDRFRRRQ